MVALLAVAVAGAVGVAAAAFSLSPARDEAEFGSARGLLLAEEANPSVFEALVADAEGWFGQVEVIGYQDVPVEGLADPLQLRAQEPEGPFGASTLRLRAGRHPSSSDEVALTDRSARDLEVGLGGDVDIGGTQRLVVGLVENPKDLDDEFGLVAPWPRGTERVDSVAVLVADTDRLRSFVGPEGVSLEVRTRAGNEGLAAALGVFVIGEVVLLLVSLIAAAGFVVVAQRRLRQLGVLAAVGATQRHLRLVMLSNGVLVGAVATSLGSAAGLASWWLAAPSLERAVGQRIDRANLPWPLIGASLVLALATTACAAWWPARQVARVPVMSALSGRPPRPKPTFASAVWSGGFVVAGVGALALAGDVADDVAVHWFDAVLVGLGTISTIGGVLLASPLVVRAMARMAVLASVAPRLALRGLGRHQARSSTALAAIGLGLGIPIAIVVGATAAQHGPSEGNLASHQILVRADPADDSGVAFLAARTEPEAIDLEARVGEIAERVGADAVVTRLDAVFDPAVDPLPDGSREVVTLGRRADEGWRGVTMLYVARAELLERLGLDPDEVDPGAEIITSESGPITLLGATSSPDGGAARAPVTDAMQVEPSYTSLPRALVTPAALADLGWEAAPSAWLIESSGPLADDQLSAARDQAAATGVTLEARRSQAGLMQLRSGATAAGILFALGILALTVGLLLTETAGDLRVLAATGASDAVHRNLTAATAGSLALGGVVLGTAGAYVGLIARSLGDLTSLASIPIVHLAALVLGVPSVAAAGGWLLARKEPLAWAARTVE